MENIIIEIKKNRMAGYGITEILNQFPNRFVKIWDQDVAVFEIELEGDESVIRRLNDQGIKFYLIDPHL